MTTDELVKYPVSGQVRLISQSYPLEYNKNISFGRLNSEAKYYSRKMQQRTKLLNAWFEYIHGEIEALNSSSLITEAERILQES